MSTHKRPAPRRSSLAGASPVRPPVEQAPEPAPAEPAAPKPSVPTPQQQSKPTAKKAKSAPSAPASGASETVRLGVYLTPEEFTAAKAGSLAAWQRGGEADTFGRWIGAAIDTALSQAPGVALVGPEGLDVVKSAGKLDNLPRNETFNFVDREEHTSEL